MKVEELGLSERYNSDMKCIQRLMGKSAPGEIELEDYNDVRRIDMILSQADVGYGRRCDYVRTICSMMKVLGKEHDEYCKLLLEYGKKYHTTKVDKNIELDVTQMKSIIKGDKVTEPGVRLMCIVLERGIEMRLKEVHEYICSEKAEELDRSIWRVKGKEYEMSEELYETLDALRKQTCKLSYRELSSKFKSATGHTYSEIYSKLNKREAAPKKARKVVVHSEERGTLRMNEIHLDNLSRMWAKIYGEQELEYNKYDSKDCYDKVIGLEKSVSVNTMISYLTAICILMEETGGRLYNEYKMYQQELMLKESRANLERCVVWFPDLYRKISEVYANSDNKSLRVMCLMIMSNVFEQDGEIHAHSDETGVLRPSDLINTRFEDDGKNSYLDLNKGEWQIRSECTKNKVERTLRVRESFVKGLKEIYNERYPSYLIVSKNGKQYSGSMSDVIKEHIGYKFDEIRSSYFTWRERTTRDRKSLLELCRRQGHKYSTAMMNYKRIPLME